MQVHEFDTREEAELFLLDLTAETDNTIASNDGKWVVTVRDLSSVQRTTMEGPDPVEEPQEQVEEEGEEKAEE